MNKTRYCLLVIAIFLALTLSALNVAPAFADESTPPEPAPTQEVTEVTEPAETEEVLPSLEESEFTEEPVTVAEVIESLPEETTLVVVDEDGEALPLASEEAAEVIKGADPRWCPVGVTPGAATCSPSFDYFTGAGGLIEWLTDPLNDAAVSKAGVIWIESAYDSTLETDALIVLDGNDFVGPDTNMDDFALTINGGWAGGTSKVLNPNDPSVFDLPFHIINWTGAVAINNIVVDGASGSGIYALQVMTDGNIVLSNVDSVGNTTEYGGALLNNDTGVGTVVVTDSTFNNNSGSSGWGLVVYSNGTVTGKNLSAMGNIQAGVYIDNSTATTPKAVTLNGTNHFSYNGGEGLTIYSKGAITLSNATAMGNTGGSGAYLVNNFSSTMPSAVTIKGTNNFSDNGWDGLRVYTYGAITISNITANDNGTDPDRYAAYFWGDDINDPEDYDFDAYGKGAYLYNANWSVSGKPQLVTLTGTNTFNGNASNGLYLDSMGVVKINNLTANENGCDPLKDINPYGCAGAYIVGAGVTITGYNFFIGNSNQGLEVYNAWVPSKNSSVGAITLSNLYAEANGQGGVWAVNFENYNITITGTNVFNDNLNDDGLFVWSNGVVTLSNITANNNGQNGVFVRNFQATTPKAVVITGTNTFNGNVFDGLRVDSDGAITTNNVTAMYNGESGVFLDNCDWDTITSCFSLSSQAVTMNGINNTSENSGDGVYIVSRGAITINNLTSNYSDNGWGAYLDNQYDNAVGGVTVKGYAFTSYNDVNGLSVYSNGAITLTNLTANGNNSRGVYIDNNTNAAKPMNVTITGNNVFSENGLTGLSVFTYGTVVLNNLTANYNGNPGTGYGAQIVNDGGTMARPVTLNGVNTFNGNFGDGSFGAGLLVASLGAIKVNNLMANDNQNGAYGAYFQNNDITFNFSSPVTITGYGIFNANYEYGLVINTEGNVSLANLTANNNNDVGVSVNANNELSNKSASVTITGFNTFNDNGGFAGLEIFADGAITLSNIIASLNDGWGAYLDNVIYGDLGFKNNITLNGTSNFIGNIFGGLYFNASGNAILTRVTAMNNNDLTVDVFFSDGVEGTAGGAITLTCGTMYNNEGYGYNLTGTVVTLKGVFTYGNPSNNFASPTAVITRTCPLP